MTAKKSRLETMAERVRGLGYRMTPQRLAVLRVLANSRKHPSVEEIYDKVKGDFPMTSLATIYKTVTLLKEIGEVMELHVGGGRNRYDGRRPEPHPHLICIDCGEIIDPDITTAESLPDEIVRETGYQIVGQRLDFFGVCPACQAARAETETETAEEVPA